MRPDNRSRRLTAPHGATYASHRARLDKCLKLASISAMTKRMPDTIKHRSIEFRGPHHNPNQAQSACLILSDLEGILHVSPAHPELLHVTYDVSYISLQVIDELLAELGFHLDNNLFMKLTRALYYYSEESQRDVLGCRHGSGNCTQAVFINRYRRLEHGCRDVRPDHWRQYL